MRDELLFILSVKVSRESLSPNCLNDRLTGDWSVSKLERLVILLIRSLELKLMRLNMI